MERKGIDPVQVVVSGAETGGRFALLTTHTQRGGEPPLHAHSREDEVVYVVEGHVTVYVGDEQRDCPAGACVVLPRGREHTFRVESGSARLLVLLLPAGLEDLYRELGTSSHLHGGNVRAGSQDVDRLVTLAAHYGVAITGSGPREPSEGMDPRATIGQACGAHTDQ
jgi:quercetin dioxygenase-like cupin family protein